MEGWTSLVGQLIEDGAKADHTLVWVISQLIHLLRVH
jgi:hypothetical protein